jgi:hypothetical protein
MTAISLFAGGPVPRYFAMRLKFFAVAVRGKGTGFIFDFRKKKINPVPFQKPAERFAACVASSG